MLFRSLLASLPDWIDAGVQVVVQGSGEAALEVALQQAAVRYPGRFSAFVGYDEGRAHRILAGSDALLMPSRFEPCGLTQLYAMRYGTVPVVRCTGGLADTVEDVEASKRRGQVGTGICFEGSTAKALTQAVRRLLALFATPEAWSDVQRQAMGKDWSWRRPAQEYVSLYRELTSHPQ